MSLEGRLSMLVAAVANRIKTIEAAIVAEVATPTTSTPANGATNIDETPTLTGSAFYSAYGDSQSAVQVQISTSSTFNTLTYDSGDKPAGLSVAIPAATISGGTTYYWRIRYKNSRGTYSDWSDPTSFTTMAYFVSYIPTPAATPAAFGDAFEGGFYTGMIWNQVVQSSTSTTIGTGSKVFTVPDMTGAPIVYAGQTLEVRSRSNPANKIVGTVTDARGQTLTLNITSVSGSGTFSDWSVMAKYRLILAPKSSGENAGVLLKNTNTALPTACQTLTEGWLATEAMKNSDTATVYPAAHWARGLTIGGKSDWYIPARDEFELFWRNLKPVTNSNYTVANRPSGQSFDYKALGSVGDTANTHGLNNNSSPAGAAYTGSVPAQTSVTAFKTGGAEAFSFGSGYYHTSSDYNAANYWCASCYSSFPGEQTVGSKTNSSRVRAVRRSII